jgi:hypothetical protein
MFMNTQYRTVTKRYVFLFLIASLLLAISLACGLSTVTPTSIPVSQTPTLTPVPTNTPTVMASSTPSVLQGPAVDALLANGFTYNPNYECVFPMVIPDPHQCANYRNNSANIRVTLYDGDWAQINVVANLENEISPVADAVITSIWGSAVDNTIAVLTSLSVSIRPQEIVTDTKGDRFTSTLWYPLSRELIIMIGPYAP